MTGEGWSTNHPLIIMPLRSVQCTCTEYGKFLPHSACGRSVQHPWISQPGHAADARLESVKEALELCAWSPTHAICNRFPMGDAKSCSRVDKRRGNVWQAGCTLQLCQYSHMMLHNLDTYLETLILHISHSRLATNCCKRQIMCRCREIIRVASEVR